MTVLMPSIRTVIIHNITSPKFRASVFSKQTRAARWGARIAYYGPGDEGGMAFTDFGIETLAGLIEIYKADPHLLKRSTDPL